MCPRSGGGSADGIDLAWIKDLVQRDLQKHLLEPFDCSDAKKEYILKLLEVAHKLLRQGLYNKHEELRSFATLLLMLLDCHRLPAEDEAAPQEDLPSYEIPKEAPTPARYVPTSTSKAMNTTNNHLVMEYKLRICHMLDWIFSAQLQIHVSALLCRFKTVSKPPPPPPCRSL